MILLPTGRDAHLITSLLADAKIACHVCGDAAELCAEMVVGAGAALAAEEALSDDSLEQLIDAFRRQPVWSDLPIMLFSSSQNAEHLLKELSPKINATIVERPIRKTILLSAVLGALRARRRQYEARDMLIQLEEADKQKDLFLATLSHELRTPLNSIVGWIKLLRGKAPQRPSDMDHALDVIERNAKAQSEIISDILFVSRVVTGKIELKLEPAGIVALVERGVDVMRPALLNKNIELDIEKPDKEIRIRADEERLRQVFLNLLSNAAKFSEPGGKIRVSIIEDGPSVHVKIADHGRGIAPEFLPHVFERFRQADNEYTRVAGGLGLGLAIVRHLIELHDGTVTAASEGLGRGSTFSVTLPVMENEAGNSEQRSSAPAVVKHKTISDGLSVLLVEDDQDSREMLMTFLKAHRMRVTAVDCASAAIDTIKSLRPDVLISDVGLPGQDGYEMMNTIRKFPEMDGGHTPAIALTGYVSIQDRDRAMASGFQEHLAKPIDFDELIDRIDRVIREPHAKGSSPQRG